METVQLTISDAPYASALTDLLERNGTRAVRTVPAPDPTQEGVIVVDSEALDSLPFPLLNPERVVLITRNDPEQLAKAWNAGIRSVVFHEDPLSTAVLAIMAAELRVPKGDARWAVCHSAPERSAPGSVGSCAAGSKSGAASTLSGLESNVHSSRPRERRG